jgi:uncharacterized protein YbjT (DUF2867 family)
MILVINGNGVTGSGVVRELVQRGANVRTLVRDRARATSAFPREVEVVVGDVTEPGSVRAAMRGVEAVYIATPAQPDLDLVERGIAKACVEHGVRRIVKLGGIRVENDTVPPLMMKLHHRGFVHLRDTGIPVVHLRASFYMQNFFMSAPEIAIGEIHAPTGVARASFVDARDIARCAAQTLTHDGDFDPVYDLTGPAPLSFADCARILATELGRPVEHVDIPTAAFVAGGIAAGGPPWVLERLGELYDHLRGTEFAAAPTDAVQRITGRAPTDFATFVREHRAAFV